MSCQDDTVDVNIDLQQVGIASSVDTVIETGTETAVLCLCSLY